MSALACHRWRIGLAAASAIAMLGGCSTIQSRAMHSFATDLTNGILDQDDPGIARAGIPSWLLLVDGLVQGSPNDVDTLLAGAKLYSAYAGGFADNPEQARRLAGHGLDYARRAVCLDLPAVCKAAGGPFPPFHDAVATVGREHAEVLYVFATAWAGNIQANSDSWQAIADIPKVQALLERVVAIDPTHAAGEPYMYLGVLATLRPAALGGQPEQGKAWFEKALALSGGRNQMVRVMFAEHYARLVFDEKLFDSLLHDAIAADPNAPGLTLVNVLAQQRARKLLATAKDYF
ncbi:MAG: TRAP transporter TatT component family protein [Lysobacterales bacterium]